MIKVKQKQKNKFHIGDIVKPNGNRVQGSSPWGPTISRAISYGDSILP